MTSSQLARIIDHTRLAPDTMVQEVYVLCEEAVQHGFASVCVPPCYVEEATRILTGEAPRVCTVVGFPLGGNQSSVKATEAATAINDGATEIDMVMAIGLLKTGAYESVAKDIQTVVNACENEAQVKVILECVLLTEQEKRTACLLARDAGAAYVKTSTGFASGGATEADVSLMRNTVGRDLGVKAAGGIRTGASALAMVRAGADRIGASASLAIIQELD
ncbi:MAG: deoxyribose-phosphate aldolase [Rhodothermaceae bacterium]|nr:deoxyribose-phosphate aldolase [Rhodothermaceae bacterium]MXX58016.1 deoxyribose-phosphate aldolase [Rhodothermaceae bacterium]MYD19922.1 deoxyribose-phosphate aldolase [Rhodothermaceae bacterium]MYD57490.1 deoxyribose-phosphate aldolase [Rhodothermaceae bacterium]MYI44240.1 deoxyribose-phosphate aldolase [Rhodothermaceae bacterium]